MTTFGAVPRHAGWLCYRCMYTVIAASSDGVILHWPGTFKVTRTVREGLDTGRGGDGGRTVRIAGQRTSEMLNGLCAICTAITDTGHGLRMPWWTARTVQWDSEEKKKKKIYLPNVSRIKLNQINAKGGLPEEQTIINAGRQPICITGFFIIIILLKFNYQILANITKICI